MTPDTTSTTLTRAERLLLAAAAMRGVLAGAAREITMQGLGKVAWCPFLHVGTESRGLPEGGWRLRA